MTTALLTIVMMLASCALPAACSTGTAHMTDDLKERDEINRTYQLAPGTSVDVSSISGSVEISNSDGATAEVQVIRTARTRADLEYHKVEVEQVGNRLVVRGVQEPGNRGQNARVNHHVIMKLPRRVDLTVSSISGSLKVGDADGETKVTSISGSVIIGNIGGPLQARSISGNFEAGNVGAEVHVTSISGNVGIRQLKGSLEVSSVSGSVKTTIDQLDTQGVRIRSVSGSVEIGFKGEINADFNAESFSGEVYLDVPGVTKDIDEKHSRVRARIGGGGSPITISSVSGNIRLTRS